MVVLKGDTLISHLLIWSLFVLLLKLVCCRVAKRKVSLLAPYRRVVCARRAECFEG